MFSGIGILGSETGLERAPRVRGLDTLLATWFGLGFVPIAPGTFGSIGGLLFFLPVLDRSLSEQWIAWMLLTVIAVWSADRAGKAWGSIDHPAIVIDEVVGLWLAMLTPIFLFPAYSHSTASLATSFFFFRIFDILKPWPINWIEKKIPGGLGVVLDDLVAGLLAGFCAALLTLFL